MREGGRKERGRREGGREGRKEVEAEGKGKPHHSFNLLESMSTMTILWTQSKLATSRSFTCTMANTCHCSWISRLDSTQQSRLQVRIT